MRDTPHPLRRRAGPTIVAAILAIYCLTSPALADRAGYLIEDFRTEISIQPNSDILVTERIVVQFSAPRHGIYRLIPNQYVDHNGFNYTFRLNVVDVSDEEGRPYATKISRDGRYVRIRIGDEYREITGQVHYAITYRVQDALGHFAHYDELYWNATGNEWEAPILHASATIDLPAAVPTDTLIATAYVGRFGSREQLANINIPRPGRIEFEYGSTLQPLQGLTVVANWPHGYVQFPSRTKRVVRFVLDNWILMAPFGALLFLLHRYRSSGRDPDLRQSLVVRYNAPPNLSPAEVGAVFDEHVGLRDITATVVDLAVRGFLRIEVASEPSFLFGLSTTVEVVFHRGRNEADSELRQHERLVLNGLFESGERVRSSDLREVFYRVVPKIKAAVETQLLEGKYFTESPSKVRNRYRLAGVVMGLAVFGIGLAWIHLRGLDESRMPHLAGASIGILFFAFSSAMPRRTPRGVELRNWALGFKEYIERVERDRLDRAAEAKVFESLLPYAMALGISKAWAKHFDDLYFEQPPAWFGGAALHGSLTTSRFEESLNSAMSSAGASFVAQPRSSSGSSGGGSSGGGGGGGGGGSW